MQDSRDQLADGPVDCNTLRMSFLHVLSFSIAKQDGDRRIQCASKWMSKNAVLERGCIAIDIAGRPQLRHFPDKLIGQPIVSIEGNALCRDTGVFDGIIPLSSMVVESTLKKPSVGKTLGLIQPLTDSSASSIRIVCYTR